MTVQIKVMTYNVQWFTGINSQLPMQKAIMNKHKAHIVGLQELTTTGKISSIGKATLSDYPYQYLSYHKNFLGVASKYAMTQVKSIDFKNQDPADMALYGETRAYMRARLTVNGKLITFINTHLCHVTQEIKFKQMKEIFNIAQKHKYVIITGDFNAFIKHMGDKEYDGLYKQFIDAGYNLADCQGGMTKTWTDRKYPKYLANLTWPTDNIITSGNIQIKKVSFDKTKLSYENGSMIDHIPVTATLQI